MHILPYNLNHLWITYNTSVQFSSVQSLSQVQLFATPWTTARQTSLSITISGVCSNSCPLSQWCHPTVLSSVIPFSSCLQSFPASGSFPRSQLFASGGQSIGTSASVLPMNIQDWLPLGLTGLIFLLSQESSPALQFKSINSSALSLLYGPTLTSIHDYWKNHSLDWTDLCQQSNVSAFKYAVWVGHSFSSKEQVSFNFMAAVTICSDFLEPKKIKSLTASIVSLSICNEVMGPDAVILVFLYDEFRDSFFTLLFHPH